MGRITRNEEIVRKMEALALDMLETVGTAGTNIDVKLDTFEKIGKWVSIKNKLDDDDGGGIAEYKKRLAEGKIDRRVSPSRRSKAEREQDTGGAALDKIKSRIPATNHGGANGHRHGDSGEDTAADLDSGGADTSPSGDQ